MAETLYLENDNRIRVTGLRDDADNLISTATVQLTEIIMACGEPVGVDILPINLAFEEPGQFSGIIPYTLEAARGEYEATIEVEASGVTARFYKRLVAVKRTG